MANEPIGDIEIIFPSPTSAEKVPAATSAQSTQPLALGHNRTTTRIRVLRAHRTIEVARSISRTDGQDKATGEWTKKIVPALGHGYYIKVPEEEFKLLDGKDKEGLDRLYRFLKICEAVEKVDRYERGSPAERTAYQPMDQAKISIKEKLKFQNCEPAAKPDSWKAKYVDPSTGAQTMETTFPAASSQSTGSLSSLRVVPRPPKFRTAPSPSNSDLTYPSRSRRT